MKNDECSICLKELSKNIEILPCKHKIHIECKKNLQKSSCPTKNKCPICRKSFYNIISCDLEESIDYRDDEWYLRINTPNISPIGNNRNLLNNIPLPIVQAMLYSIPTETS